MLAKSAPEDMDPSRVGDQQGHPVIRTLYDHTEEVAYLEFHPKEQILASASRDCTVKLFDISKASVKKAHKVFTVRFCVQKIVHKFFINSNDDFRMSLEFVVYRSIHLVIT